MTNLLNFVVEAPDADVRLDVFLASRLAGLTRSGIKRLMDAGSVTLNSRPAKPGQRLRPDDIVTAAVPVVGGADDTKAEALALDILYEDSDVIVINKPAGMAVHPGAGRKSGTLVNALLAHTSSLAPGSAPDRPGIVHRLDMDTSGVLVVAKNGASYASLAAQFKEHSTVRRYLALVWGAMKDDAGVIDIPLGRDVTHRKKISARTRKARSAETRYRVLKRYRGLTLVELTLKTGRTHQVRAHLASIHHPVAADPVYGGRRKAAGVGKEAGDAIKAAGRQLLHAATLGFIHPGTGMYMEWSVPLPADMGRVIDALEAD
ncbi:MAG: RluA family pseudouridine synthase [Deltaproteobacteria bacterium]|nr:RluA family pseudouridine synthase [Deltaproteobacteria bacterium]